MVQTLIADKGLVSIALGIGSRYEAITKTNLTRYHIITWLASIGQ